MFTKNALARQIAFNLVWVLITSLFVLITLPTTHALAANQCSPITDANAANGYDSGDISITPLHGQVFYTDLRNGVNASYVGYAIKNDTASSINELWLEISDFRSSGTSVLTLANPADAFQPIGTISAGQTKNIFVLIKSSAVTTSSQTHDVKVHRGYPGGISSIYTTGANKAECYYTFETVNRTIAANSNKVQSMSVDDLTPEIGGTVTVTVTGATGTPGSGTSSVDGSIMWLSGASSSIWPTQALRLESTNLSVKYRKSSSQVSFANTLLLRTIDSGVNGGNNSTKFTSSTTYTATFTFRVLNSATSDAEVKPVAQIASGTQIKHTGQYPAPLRIKLTSSVNTISAVKTITSIGALSSGYYPVNYQITLTDSDVTKKRTIDAIIDVPENSALFSTNSARIIDDTRTTVGGVQLLDPIDEDSSSTGKRLVFGGPFTFNASGNITLTYTMLLKNVLNNTYHNTAYGRIGSKIIAQTNGNVTICSVIIPPSGSPTNSCSEEPPPKQDQTIEFIQMPSLGVGVNYTLDATASSGLAVTYISNSTDVCTISGVTLTIISQGTCSVTASQSGDANWNPALSVTRTVTTLPGQIITFTTPATMTVGQTKSDIPASSNVGLLVTVTSLTTDVCTVTSQPSSPNFQVSVNGVAAGACVLVASQSGGTIGAVTYGAALDVERTINIGSSQTITFTTSPADGQSGPTGSTTIAARSRNSSNVDTNLVITFTSKTPDVCTAGDVAANSITNAGLLATSGPGDASGISTVTVSWTSFGICIIAANQDGITETGTNSGYAPASEVIDTFTIGSKVPSVTITAPASVNSAAVTSITVTITTPAEHPASGTAALAGTLNLYASGTRVPASAIQSSAVSVSVAKNVATNFTFSVTAGTLAAGAANESYELTSNFVTSNSNFESATTLSATSVIVNAPPPLPTAVTSTVSSVTVNSAVLNGSFHPQSTTSTTATMLFGTSASVSDSVNVGSYSTNTSSSNAPQSFSGSATTLDSATRYYFQSKAVRGSDSGLGTIESFMTLPSTPTIDSITAGANVATVNFTGVTSGPGVTLTYYVICTSVGRPNVEGSSTTSPISLSNLQTSVAGVTYACTIKARATHSDNTVQGGGYGAPSSATNLTTQPEKLSRTANLTPSGVSVVYGSSISNTVSGTDASSNALADTDGTKSISKTGGTGDCSIASLNLTGTSVGTCIIKGVISEGSSYKQAESATSSISVTAKPLTITAGNVSISVGDNYPGNSYTATDRAFSDVIGSVEYDYYNVGGSDPLNSAPTFAGSYVIRPKNASFSTGSASNYQLSYVDGTLTIGKRNHTITFNPLSNKTWGDSNEQNLPATTSASRNITFSTNDALICDITGSAGSYKVRFLKVGTCQVTASASADDEYNAATAAAESALSRSFVVSQKSATVTVGSPSAITYGDSTPVNTFSDSGLAGTDDISSVTYRYYDSSGNTLLADTPTNAGTYKIRSSVPIFASGSSSNYSITHVDGTLTINKKSRTISIDEISNLSDWSASAPTLALSISAGSSDGTKSYATAVSSSGCTVDSGTGAITITSAGTCKITSSIAEGSNHLQATSSERSFSIGKKTQSLTLNSATIAVATATYALSASSNATSNNSDMGSYIYEIDSTPGNPSSTTGCSVVGSTLSFTQGGNCYVKVSRTGNTDFWTNASTVTQFIISAKTVRTIRIKEKAEGGDASGSYDQNGYTWGAAAPTLVSEVSVGSSDGSKTYSLDGDSTGCSVDESTGAVTFTSFGTCKVRVAIGETASYAAANSTVVSFVISKKAATVTAANKSITYGQATPDNGFTDDGLTGSDDISGVTFNYYNNDGTGPLLAAPTAAGTYKIRTSTPVFGVGNSNNYTISHVDGTLTINKKDHEITFNALTNKTIGDATEQDLPTTSSAGRNISFTTNDASICAITGSAGAYKVQYLAVGTCTVTSSSLDSNHNAATAAAGSSLVRSFVISSAGKSSRTIRIKNNGESGASTSYSVSGYSNWGLTPPTLVRELSAGSGDGDETYTLDETSSGCSVNASSGAVSFTGAGTCKVRISITEGTNFNSATSTLIQFTIGKKGQTIEFPELRNETYSNNLSTQALPRLTSESKAITYSVNDLSVCEIIGTSPNFSVKGKRVGTCVVTATSPEDGNYNAAVSAPGSSLSRTYSIAAKNASLSAADRSITYGSATPANSFTPTGLNSGDEISSVTYTYFDSTGTKQLASAPTNVGTYIIRASAAVFKNGNPANYSLQYIDATYTIAKRERAISISKLNDLKDWRQKPSDLDIKISQGELDGDLEIFVGDGSQGCELNNADTRTIRVTGAGLCIVGANISRGINHADAKAELISFKIGKVAPIIKWSNPAPIVEGDPLTAVQLSAKSDVPGSFTYQNYVGETFKTGNYELNAQFTPADKDNFESAELSVYLEVLTRLSPKAEGITTLINRLGKTVIVDISSRARIQIVGFGEGITRARTSGNQIIASPQTNFIGMSNVQVKVVQGIQSVDLEIPVKVIPEAPSDIQFKPIKFGVTSITWSPSIGAKEYEVTSRGEVVCTTNTTQCVVDKLMGPATPLAVVAKVTEDVVSDFGTGNYKKPDSPIIAAVKNFKTASAELSAQAKTELEDFALLVKAEGFSNFVVYGHTDNRKGIDNLTLSYNRAKSAISYLEPLLPDVTFKIGYFADSRPVKRNNSAEGRAANRRAEIYLG